MAKLVYGISKVEFGDAADEATMPGVLTQFAETSKGSFTLNETEAETVDAETEESAAPIDSITSKMEILEGSWRILDHDPAKVALVKGGTAGADNWAAPGSAVEIRKALKLTTTAGPTLNVYKAKLTGRFTGTVTKEGYSEIEIKFKALAPAAGISPYKWADFS